MLDKDKMKVLLKESITEAWNKYGDENTIDVDFYLGEETIDCMANSALAVMVGVEDIQNYMDDEKGESK